MNKKGQATVEFALAALVVLTLLFAIIDLALMFYVNLTMLHAVREATRYVVTGRTGADSNRRSALTAKIREFSYGLYDSNALDQKDPTVSVLTPANTAGFTNYSGEKITDPKSTGSPDQIIIVRLTYAWPLLTPVLKPFFTDGRYTFTASATMKNEPWNLL